MPSGESGIRTHAPFRTNGFQDRLVMTTSISLRMCVLSLCHLCCSPDDKSYSNKKVCYCQHIFTQFLFLKMSTLNSTFFHIFIVLPFCTIRGLFYCIFSLLGSAIVRLPLLPASHAPYFRSYASCFTSSSNSSPAE